MSQLFIQNTSTLYTYFNPQIGFSKTIYVEVGTPAPFLANVNGQIFSTPAQYEGISKSMLFEGYPIRQHKYGVNWVDVEGDYQFAVQNGGCIDSSQVQTYHWANVSSSYSREKGHLEMIEGVKYMSFRITGLTKSSDIQAIHFENAYYGGGLPKDHYFSMTGWNTSFKYSNDIKREGLAFVDINKTFDFDSTKAYYVFVRPPNNDWYQNILMFVPNDTSFIENDERILFSNFLVETENGTRYDALPLCSFEFASAIGLLESQLKKYPFTRIRFQIYCI